MSDTTTKYDMPADGKFAVPDVFQKRAYIKSIDEYKQMYERSIADPEGFWSA